jgi:MFS family permease
LGYCITHFDEGTSMFSLLRRRNFALLSLGGFLSSIGTYALLAALPYYVYATSHSVAASGTAVVSEMLPGVIFNMTGGVFADRLPRKLTMSVGNAARGVLILPLLAVHGPTTIWIVYVVGFLNQSVGAFAGPFGNAALPRIVPSSDLIRANGFLSAMSSTAMLVGSPIGGWLLQQWGVAAVVIVDAISFFVPTIAILLIDVPLEERREQESDRTKRIRRIASDFALSWRYAWHHRTVRGVFLVTVTNLLATGIFEVAFAPFVRHVLHGSPVFYSWALTLQGASGIAGALMMGAASKRAGPRALISGGLVSLGLMSIVEVVAVRQPVTLAVSLLVGPPAEAIGASQNALLQASVADAFRGRVLGARGTTWSATMLASTLTATLVTDRIGIRSILIGGGVLLMLSGLTALPTIPREMPVQEEQV